MIQTFIFPSLTRSVFFGALAGSVFAGFYGVQGIAIASPLQNPDAAATIQSNHWAFQSLKSLVERYGCVINPSGLSFPPDATPSRYEMAAAVNECLDQIADRFTSPDDRVLAQALFQEFKSEVAVLRRRVDQLGLRAADSAQQFSPTTKISQDPEFYNQFPGLPPTHWSFQAIESLSQRYHCTPTLNSKGEAISRYEMAVAINTCFNLMGHRFANQTDLETAQSLQKEFKPELTALKDRITSLEKSAETLQSHQFSATTKFQGQTVITIQGGGFR